MMLYTISCLIGISGKKTSEKILGALTIKELSTRTCSSTAIKLHAALPETTTKKQLTFRYRIGNSDKIYWHCDVSIVEHDGYAILVVTEHEEFMDEVP